jgi:Domain of unknown function (DUF4114)
MADIGIGASIDGSLTSSDQKNANGDFYDEYNLKLTDNRVLTFAIERPKESPTSLPSAFFSIIDTATGNYYYYGGASDQLNFHAGDYKLRVNSSTLGNYKLSTTDDGRITSFVSVLPTIKGSQDQGGFITDKGEYLQGLYLNDGGENFLSDVAITRLTPRISYGVGPDSFSGGSSFWTFTSSPIPTSGVIKDTQGNTLLGSINSLAVSDENKIYTIESTGTPLGNTAQNKLYTIDPKTNIASLVGNLPKGFLSSGDLVYDSATKSFFATSVDTATSDALWQIPVANPAGASKIGQIGFTNVTGLNLDGAKLIGFNNVNSTTNNQLTINKVSGVGTIERTLSGTPPITGAATIPTLLAATVPNPITPSNPTPITPTPTVPTPITPTPVTPTPDPTVLTPPGNTQINDISLGQSITDSIVSGGSSSKEYNLKGVDGFRQLNITTTSSNTAASYTVELINAATGAVISQDIISPSAPFSIAQTTFPGVNYKIRVTGAKAYTLSVTDGGKATSLVSLVSATNAFISSNANGLANESAVGTIGQNGAYSSLGLIAGKKLYDIARSSDGQFYGLGDGSTLYRIDPSLESINQAKSLGSIKDTQGKVLILRGSSIDFGPGNKLYTLGTAESSLSTIQLYQIDITNNGPVATSIGKIPSPSSVESIGLSAPNEIVYDAANNRFLLATGNASTNSSDLWQIPVNNPGGTSKIGTINYGEVNGLEFENGQLFGFTGNVITNQGVNRIKIDINNATSTVDTGITGIRKLGIEGASELQDGSILPSPNPIAPTTSLNQKPVFPTSAPNAIGTKGQSLINRMIDLTSYAGQTLKVDTVSKGDAAYINNVGFYVVQDEIGTIKLANGSTLKPSDANYAMEAIKSAILQAGKIDSKLNRDIIGGEIYAPVVVAQGSFNDFVNKNPTNGGGGDAIHAYFNYLGANSDKFDHFRLVAPNTFAVEDQYGGGDKDFNDLVVNMNVKIA